ncbi:uncharacterized protein LOC141901636 [Tubulanus polymorphus]|uniref:uncharacterized protein LOC141901636 n=1 Tax=Tubulanus polymorphus TaxID=672921 RepID=UPI003DA366C1
MSNMGGGEEELTYDFFINEYRSCMGLSQLHQKAESRIEAHENLLQIIVDCVYQFPFKVFIVESMFKDMLKQPDVSSMSCKHLFVYAEKYALNLLHQPWKNEIKIIKQHTGVFQNISCCSEITTYLYHLGYSFNDETNEYKLTRHVDREQLIACAFDCFIALAKLEFFTVIYRELERFGYTWFQLMMTMVAGHIPAKFRSEMVDWIHDNVTPEKIVKVKRQNANQRELDDITDEDLYGYSSSEPIVDDVLEFASADEHRNRSFISLMGETNTGKRFDVKSQMRRPSNDSILSKLSSIDSVRYDIDRMFPESEQESDMSIVLDIKQPPIINDERYSDLLHNDTCSLKTGQLLNGNRSDRHFKHLPPSHALSDSVGRDREKLMSKYQESLATRVINKDLNLSAENLKANSLTDINQKKYISASGNLRPERRNVMSDIVYEQTREDFKPPSFLRSQSHDVSLSILSTQNECLKARSSLSAKHTENSLSEKNLLKHDDKTMWTCVFCTMKNERSTQMCSVCSKSRYRGAECTRLRSGGRECPYCTFINDENKKICKQCENELSKSSTYV